MNSLNRFVAFGLALAALVVLSGARQGEVGEYTGDEITSEEGIVILKVVWDRTKGGGGTRALNRDDDQIYGVFKESLGGKRKVVVENIDTNKAFILPAGRWYLAEIRTPRQRNLPEIARAQNSFEVLGNHINYGGVYTVRLKNDPDGKQSFDTSIEYNPGPVEEAATQWPEIFTKKTLMYCATGKKCKSPSEIKF